MAERETRRQFFRKVGEFFVGGLVTFGLLGGPAVILAIGYRKQEDLREMSRKRRYEVSIFQAVRIPPFASLMPPIVVPERIEIRNGTFYTNDEPITRVDGVQHRYTLRDVIRSNQEGSYFDYLKEYVVVDPARFVIRDRLQEVR